MARKLKPGEKSIVERTLLELEHRDVPAEVNKIRFHVGKTLNHWDNGKLSGPEKGLIIADYEYILRDFSEGQVAEACAEWLDKSRFKPVPADIADLARNIASRDRENIRRARVVLGLEPPRNWEKPALPKPESVERPGAAGLLAALADKMAGRTRKGVSADTGPRQASTR